MFVHVEGQQGRVQEKLWDFVAAYVIPKDIWYIIPEKRVRGSGG